MSNSHGLPQQPPGREAKRTPRRRSRRGGLVLLLATMAVIGIAIAAATSGGSGATYKARVTNTAVINPADLAVTIQVTNTGHAAGSPQCTVNAQDPSGAYSGFNEGTLEGKVQPGRTVTSVMNVTITHQGAQYVTQATASCS